MTLPTTASQPGRREQVSFASGSDECAAWFYPGTNGGCVIMTGGFGVTRGPGTDLFASRFHRAGFAVLAFDYRRLGESGGSPRQLGRVRDELADWQAAISYAGTLPGVDPAKLAVWSFSSSGGHIFLVAARNPQLAAAIAQSPNANGLAVTRNAARYQTPAAMARFTGRGILDGLGRLAGRPPRLVELTGEPGTVAVLTTPDARDGGRALRADQHPQWQQQMSAWSALRLGWYRPGRHASRAACKLLVVVCDQDSSVPAGPAARAASRAPGAELVRLPGAHYAPFLAAHEPAVAAELSFLRRHLLGQQPADGGNSAIASAPVWAGRS
jgi:alpha-beta hydrolase superfamily lysophospholipase